MRSMLACVAAVGGVLFSQVALAQAPVGGGSGETTGAPSTGSATDSSATTTTSTPATTPPAGDSGESITDVAERDHKTYYFVGVRYRGTVIPQFMMNLFVNEGTTLYSNMVGIELDVRKDHFSMIPALNYIEYGMDNTLFLQKGKDANDPGNWSMVRSTLAGVYLTLDLLWSTQVQKNIDFEYGVGLGVGVLFGNIYNNWVTTQPSSNPNVPSIKASNNQTYYQCQTATDGPGCAAANHNGATVGNEKVTLNKSNNDPRGYVEPKWFDGGSVPNLFIHLALPMLGLRIKPIKQLEMRIGGGFSLTGFYFNISGNYGLTK